MSDVSTYPLARDEMLAALNDAWAAGAAAIVGYVPEIFWDGVGVPSEPDPDRAFAHAAIRHTVGQQASLAGADGRRRWEKIGIITVGIFAPLAVAGGLGKGERLAVLAKGAFEGKATPSGVWFRNVRISEVGAERAWYHWNVVAEFRYDEFA